MNQNNLDIQQELNLLKNEVDKLMYLEHKHHTLNQWLLKTIQELHAILIQDSEKE